METANIRNIAYNSHVRYTYRCNWGDWETEEQLPAGKECVHLNFDDPARITDARAVPSAGLGTHPTPGASLGTTTVVDQDKTDEYVCYSPPTTICADTCYGDVVNPVTGDVEHKEVECQAPVTNCVLANEQTVASLEGGIKTGPDGRPIEEFQAYTCQSGPVPRCLEEQNCVLNNEEPSGILPNGVATTHRQDYVCTNETTACAEVSEVSNCVHANAWGWDELHHKSTMATGLGDFNKAMAKVDAIEKGINDNDIYIFSGVNLRCRYSVGNFLNTAISIVMVIAAAVLVPGGGFVAMALKSTTLTAETIAAINLAIAAYSIGSAAATDIPNSKAFGGDCCKDTTVEGKMAWYKLKKCTADEAKLAIANRKGLTQYMGTYCSKKAGFPVRQCVEKTKSYCVFDDMLALIVNRQGRAQLDEIAMADSPSKVVIPDMAFPLFAEQVDPVQATQANPHAYSGRMDNGGWKKLFDQAGSQAWYWQFPGYCRSPELQQAAHDTYMDEVNASGDTTGTRPQDMDMDRALELLVTIGGIASYQDCADEPGTVYFMTCSDKNNACDESKLPEMPDGGMSDIQGEDISEMDVRWRIQRVKANYRPGQYGVTMYMDSNSSYAAVTNSISELATAVGSCQEADCLFKFVLTQRGAGEAIGANKRIKDYIRFPLYTIQQSTTYPAVDYVSPTGEMAVSAWHTDPNKGLGDSTDLNNHRFVFRPNFIAGAPKDNIHSHVLLEWSAGGGESSWVPILVPTNLPPATEGFYPYGDKNNPKGHFYITGGCDVNSRWCEYQVEADLAVPRHPWGDAKNPRCWGFSIEQLAALDFDRMDLSEWINSLDLSSASEGLSESAAQAMTDRVMETSQKFYDDFKEGNATQSPLPGQKALWTNTDTLPILSGEVGRAYTLDIGVTANWPTYYADESANQNPVSNVIVDWGDGSPKQVVPRHPEGRAYVFGHSYDIGIDKGFYKVVVTLDTANNGSQTLSTLVEITPDAGQSRAHHELDFNKAGSNGKHSGDYIPAETPNGVIADKQTADVLSPGSSVLYEKQGDLLQGPQRRN